MGVSEAALLLKMLGNESLRLLLTSVTIKDFRITMGEVLSRELKHSLASLHITVSTSQLESMETNSCHFIQKSRAWA
jgi:hypothetical protein